MKERNQARKYFECLREPTQQMEITNKCERNAECWKAIGVCVFFNVVSRELEAGDSNRLESFPGQNFVPESC